MSASAPRTSQSATSSSSRPLSLARARRRFGGIPTYHLMIIVLGVISVAAFVYSFAGLLYYTPLQLAASLLVFVAFSVLASTLMAMLFSTRAHTQSAIITGLLLFFLFWPSSDPAELSTFALVAVVAGVSKFLLAFRGRHLFNPAAVAALIIGLTGLTSTVWWVASPLLLPFVAAGAVLVLQRSRKLLLGAAFVLLSVALVVVQLLAFGTDPASALATALTSYPIVFLAGFMLSEPITLPPRRWQQLTEAVIVAVAFSVPFNLGVLYSTPELALVIGNLFAFLVARPRGAALTFTSRRQLTPTSVEYEFSTPSGLGAKAGQYLELHVPHTKADRRGSRRFFTISSPAETARVGQGPQRVSIALRNPEYSSTFKRELAKLEVGDRVRAVWVGGDFTLPADTGRPVLLVAGGIGVTPFISQLTTDRAADVRRDAVLVYQVSSPQDIPFRELLESLDLPVILVSPVPPVDLAFGWSTVSSLESLNAVSLLRDAAGRAAYISGAPAFVRRARGIVRERGIRRIRTDHFSGY